jgi:hypothetical protein
VGPFACFAERVPRLDLLDASTEFRSHAGREFIGRGQDSLVRKHCISVRHVSSPGNADRNELML